MKSLSHPAVVAVGAVALMGAFLTACLGNPNFPTVVEPVVFTITDLRIGTGAAADNGDLLTIEFTLWLYDETQPDFKGQQVQTTVGNPLKFLVGSGSAIAAINRGVVGMRVGGRRRLLVPESGVRLDRVRGNPAELVPRDRHRGVAS